MPAVCVHADPLATVSTMQEAKSEIASQARMALLMPRSSAAASARPRAPVVIHVKARDGYKEVRGGGVGGGVGTQFAAAKVHLCRWPLPEDVPEGKAGQAGFEGRLVARPAVNLALTAATT